jgi:hypothetical protein
MTLSQFVVREDPRLYGLIARYPWILASPPVPPVPRSAASDPDGDPVVLRP